MMAADVARAVRWARDNASRLGSDPSRLLLCGHSAGAHLAAIVATDPRFLEAVGMAMDACHQKLRLIGVSSPSLEALVEAVGPHALGAKLTGAGGGGCMIALAREPQRVAEAIEIAGGRPLISKLGAPGVHLL